MENTLTVVVALMRKLCEKKLLGGRPHRWNVKRKLLGKHLPTVKTNRGPTEGG